MRGGQREALVAVDQRVVARERMQQRGGFLLEHWICVRAERRRLRTRERRLEQPVVADHGLAAERTTGHVQQVLEFEEDHSPSRRSASA